MLHIAKEVQPEKALLGTDTSTFCTLLLNQSPYDYFQLAQARNNTNSDLIFLLHNTLLMHITQLTCNLEL